MLELLNQLDGFQPNDEIKVMTTCSIVSTVLTCVQPVGDCCHEPGRHSGSGLAPLWYAGILPHARPNPHPASLALPSYLAGRLDRKIEFPHPDEAARARIMQIHARKMNVK